MDFQNLSLTNPCHGYFSRRYKSIWTFYDSLKAEAWNLLHGVFSDKTWEAQNGAFLVHISRFIADDHLGANGTTTAFSTAKRKKNH